MLAMLLDKPAAEIRRALLGKKLAKESWSALTCNSRTESAKILRDNVAKFLARRLPWLSPNSFSAAPSLDAIAQGSAAPTFAGRGAVTIRYRHARHIVAFDRGTIYDPAQPAPIDSAEFLRQINNADARIENIYSEPRKEN